MGNDLRLLTQFEVKRIWRASRYWLRLIGFEPKQSRMLSIYIFLFWVFWAYAMWSYAVEQVFRAHNTISSSTIAALTPLIPPLILGAQLLYLIQVLREPPLKLASADLHYVATAPVSRGIIAWIQFMVNLTIPALVISMASALIAMFFAPGGDHTAAGISGLWAFVASLGLTYLSAALCWSLALLKQNQATQAARWRFWFAIPLFLAITALFPQGMLLPGQAWLSVIETHEAAQLLILLAELLGGILLTFGLLVAAGNRLHMARVIADSQLYARIQKLGLLGRLIASDVIERIRRQASLSRKRVLHPWFSSHLRGLSAIVGQSFVTLMRASPGATLRLFINGSVLASTGLFLLSLGGAPSLPSWMILYILLLRLRPRDVVRGFRAHGDQPFMRQLIPVSNLHLFLRSIALPFAITAVGMLATLLVQRRIDPLTAGVVSLSCLMTLTLCMAVETVPLRRLHLPRIAYEYSLLASALMIIFGGYLSRSLWGAAAASMLVNIVLMFMLEASQAS